MENPPEWVTLTDGEKIVWSAPPSLRPYAVEMLVPVVVVVAGLAVLVVPISGLAFVGALPAGVTGLAQLALAGVLALIGVAAVAGELLRWYSHRYLVTTEEVYHKRGIVSRDVTNLPMDSVENTSFTQSTIGRLLSYGDVHVVTAGTDGSEVVFTKVDDPSDVVEHITRQMAAE